MFGHVHIKLSTALHMTSHISDRNIQHTLLANKDDVPNNTYKIVDLNLSTAVQTGSHITPLKNSISKLSQLTISKCDMLKYVLISEQLTTRYQSLIQF